MVCMAEHFVWGIDHQIGERWKTGIVKHFIIN